MDEFLVAGAHEVQFNQCLIHESYMSAGFFQSCVLVWQGVLVELAFISAPQRLDVLEFDDACG